MRRYPIAVVLPLVLGSTSDVARTQGAPPNTDIFLAALALRDGRVVLGRPVNITSRAGYDNQPAFLPDSRSVLFTSRRSDGQTDIYRYDIASRATSAVTRTPESEYSATPVPGGTAISVIRVELDSTQRLWRFPLGGGEPSLVLAGVKPVGYHAWGDARTLLLFVLGNPNTLQLADASTGRADTVLTSVGRSLHLMRDGRRFSFVHKVAEGDWWIKSLAPASREITPLVKLPDRTEDYAWLPDGSAIAGSGSKLVRWKPGGSAWEEVADLAAAGLAGITRLAVSPRGDRLALVAEPAAPRAQP